MIPGAAHPVATPHYVIVRQRCSGAGLPVWRFDATGALITPPTEQGPLGRWLRCPFLCSTISNVVCAWLSDDDPDPLEIFPGARLIPMEDRARRRRTSITAVLALGPDAINAEQFAACCQSAQLDAAIAAEAVRTIAIHTERDTARLADWLRWMNGDLSLVHHQERTLDTISQQLSESYEEMSLLYKLREYMNELDQPKRFVRQTCFELHAVLPFRWIAAQFVGDATRARGLAGGSFSSGSLPCSAETFATFAAGVVDGLEPGRCLMLDQAERGPLAAGPSQVLVHPITREGRVIGAFLVGDKVGDEHEITNIELKMIEAAVGYVTITIENATLYDDQHEMFLGTLRALTASIDAKDPYTCGHSERVADLSAQLARARGLTDQACERIRIAGLVHDIGKIGVPESVLMKPGRLTEVEFGLMKQHPQIGFDILRDIPQLQDVLPGVLHHHERFDGRGYPAGLSGAEIPLIARIMALADSFDAMSSNRTYRDALDRTTVLTEVRTCAGSQFDPELVEDFLALDFSHHTELLIAHRTQRDRRLDEPDTREAAA